MRPRRSRSRSPAAPSVLIRLTRARMQASVLIASAVVGLVWMPVSPTLGFGLVAVLTLTARLTLLLGGSRGRPTDV